jgi:hypothetical protein
LSLRLADDGRYRPVVPEPDGSLVSHTTGVTFRLEGQSIRMIETATGKPFLRTPEKAAELAEARVAAAEATRIAAQEREAREEATRIAAQEREARLALEEEVARLRRELERPSKT